MRKNAYNTKIKDDIDKELWRKCDRVRIVRMQNLLSFIAFEVNHLMLVVNIENVIF